ncbi:MAG: site-specific DNA-methyltransferase [Pirellulaceae bacterium]|nr:site-specific DNA-methyltransferase [Pirellulaceae bacterium]
MEVYRTRLGRAVLTKSEEYLPKIPAGSVDLVMTSPPFALLRQKSYGNLDQAEYVDWLVSFGTQVHRVLKETGSFVIDLGGAYQRGAPVRSLYNFRVLLRLCDEYGFYLAEDFYWHNPAKLPSPIEWVNKRKIRAKDSVNTVWWLSKTENPKANVSNVLAPYSKRMKQLIKDPQGFFKPDRRPSGHDVTEKFGKDNGGAIPANLLQYPNTESNSVHIRLCKALGIPPHPARFPRALPEFFIKFLTEPGDKVLDIFAGSNTTGEAAELLGRKWLALERELDYVIGSAFRFLGDRTEDEVAEFVRRCRAGETPIKITSAQPMLF